MNEQVKYSGEDREVPRDEWQAAQDVDALGQQEPEFLDSFSINDLRDRLLQTDRVAQWHTNQAEKAMTTNEAIRDRLKRASDYGRSAKAHTEPDYDAATVSPKRNVY